jgi:hypothetical protein
MIVDLSEKEVRTLLSWLGFQAHEVDIDKESFELFKKLEPMIEVKHRAIVDNFYRIYKEQQS